MFRDLDWRWIAIGVAIMFGLNLIASLILVPLIGDSVPATAERALFYPARHRSPARRCGSPSTAADWWIRAPARDRGVPGPLP